jgi:phosphohistidine phosphatase SixA
MRVIFVAVFAAIAVLPARAATTIPNPHPAPDTTTHWRPPRDSTITTILFVRHAEKNTTLVGTDVPLSDRGAKRARELARVAGEAGVTAIYATPTKRAIETVRPIAAQLGDSVTVLDDKAETARRLSHDHWGQTVLVSGHSDNIPDIIEAITGKRVPPFGSDFDVLYVVTLTRDGRSSIVRLRYGE